MKVGKQVFVLVMFFVLTGCSYFNNHNQSRSYSSIASFLYPGKTASNSDISVEPAVPVLNIPLKVGIAFVPESCGTFKQFNIDESLKNKLMNDVSDLFKEKDIIQKIEIIPSGYLQRKGGFRNLNRVKEAFDIDIIVLLSYDQVQYTEQNLLSMVYYYTVVGKYVFSGDKNDTVTLVNATVYDIKSRKLLFQALGKSQVKGTSTRAYLIEELRQDSHKGFKNAVLDVSINLEDSLDKFKAKLKKEPEIARVVYRPSYSGGGYTDVIYAIISLLLLASMFKRKISKR